MNQPSTDYPFFFTWSAQKGHQPLDIRGGQGIYFDTADGNRWTDMASLVYQANLGHGHPRLIQAIRDQAADLCLTLPNAVYEAKQRLAEELLALAPDGFGKVFFTLGGSEATENALKIARLVTGRSKFLSRYRSYHGATMGALSLTGDYRRLPFEPGIPGVSHFYAPYCERLAGESSPVVQQAEYRNDVADRMAYEGKDKVAALFIESVTGANGVLVPPDGYLQYLRELCDANGVLMVCDEVLTGFGRTGKWFAYEHFDIVPDIITMGKALTGGYGTLGAVLVHDRIASHFDDAVLYAGLTHYAHPLGCAAALEAISVYRDEELVENAARLAPVLRAEMERIQDARPDRIRAVRAIGLFGGFVLDADKTELGALSAELDRRRVLTHLRTANQMLIVSPPLCITEAELREGLAMVAEAIDTSIPKTGP